MNIPAELFAPPRIVRRERHDGSVVLESAEPLQPHEPNLGGILRYWADVAPDSVLAAQRDKAGRWQSLTYGQAREKADSLAQAFLDQRLGPDCPLLVLSGNSLDHLTLMLACYTAGVPIAPVSVAYSLLTGDHSRLESVAELVRPGMVFAEDGDQFAGALRSLAGIPALTAESVDPATQFSLADLMTTNPASDVQRAFESITSDSVAKILFTSGSTGTPKGVPNTHRMLCSNQQMMRQVWPFLTREKPVLVDWLPWSHTFGGNHNVNMVLANGGTLYIDDGKPSPDLFGRTLEALREVHPTVYFNVPAGYAQLVPVLEQNRELADAFFSRLRLIFNAGAALPAATRTRLSAVARSVAGRDIPVTGSWGATETAPAVTTAHFHTDDPTCIGVPLPGATVKLVPYTTSTNCAPADP